MAGRDTTAYALAWALWLLASHPEVQVSNQEVVSDVCRWKKVGLRTMGLAVWDK